MIGKVGCGGSTLMAKTVTSIRTWFGPNTAIVLRFLGTTPDSLDLYTILFTLVSQISAIFHLNQSGDYKLLCSNTRSCLNHVLREVEDKVSADRRLFLVLDGLDKISPDVGDAHCLSWLPRHLPRYVHLIASYSGSNRHYKTEPSKHVHGGGNFLRDGPDR